MEIRRKENKELADSVVNVNEIGLYLRFIIDIYSSTEIKRKFWLTEREKQFYIGTIIHILHGEHNPISEESLAIYKKYFNPQTNKVKISDYINRIRKKGWLRYNKKERYVTIPEIFDGISLDGDSITFNLRFTYESINGSDTSGAPGKELTERGELHNSDE